MQTYNYEISSLLDKFPVGVMILDMQDQITSINEKALDFLGISIQDTLAEKIEQVIPDVEFCEALSQIRQGKTESQNIPLTRENRFLNSAITRTINETTGQSEVLVVIEDITRLKKIDSVKNEFLSTVLHKIRNPLTTLKTTLSILTSKEIPSDSTAFNEVLEMSFHEVNRLNNLFNDLRNMFYIDTGLAEKEFDVEDIELATVLDRAIEKISKSSDDCSNIREYIKINGDQSCRVKGDFEKLKLIFYHLLKNAMIFSPGEPGITVNIEKDSKQAVMEICDNGIGISESEQIFLFSKFYRADNDITRTTDGNGLGLYITKSLVELMGGTIYCERKKGSGTCFVLTLPVK